MVTGFSTEGPGEGRPEGAAKCNECNEGLEAARKTISTARRLALVADNAILNGDLPRARAALRELHDLALVSTTSSEDRANSSRQR